MSIDTSAVKRIAKDVRDVVTDTSLREMGIYYCHSDTNVQDGEALIRGPADSLYEGGLFLFSVHFPREYPHRPPVFKILTGDGRIRLHPNLYRNGKVCLSLLNTWSGPSWTGCQSLRTILLALLTQVLLTQVPILCEPGVTRSHSDFDNYHRIVAYGVHKVAMYDMIHRWPGQMAELRTEGERILKDNKEAILKGLAAYGKAPAEVTRTMLYRQSVHIDFDKLLGDMRMALEKLN